MGNRKKSRESDRERQWEREEGARGRDGKSEQIEKGWEVAAVLGGDELARHLVDIFTLS